MDLKDNYTIQARYSDDETHAFDVHIVESGDSEQVCTLSRSNMIPGNWCNPGEVIGTVHHDPNNIDHSVTTIKLGKRKIVLDCCEFENLLLLMQSFNKEKYADTIYTKVRIDDKEFL